MATAAGERTAADDRTRRTPRQGQRRLLRSCTRTVSESKKDSRASEIETRSTRKPLPGDVHELAQPAGRVREFRTGARDRAEELRVSEDGAPDRRAEKAAR